MSVYSVNVYPSSTTIKAGNWYYGAYAVVNANSDCYTDVTWYSSNTNVATVNASSGYIYGSSPGTAKIYAQSTVDSSKKDYITVTVTSGTICVDSVTLNKSSISLEKGDTITLSATVYPTNATNKSITWRSTNTSVATVCGGVVAAMAKGYAYIYAEAQDGSGEYATCYVNVTEDVLVSSVTVDPSCKTMNIGGSVYLYETVCPSNATNKCVKWSSNNTCVATVNPDTGLVMAQGAGTATITATAQDGSNKKGYCTITVNEPVAVTGIEVCPTSLTMNVGDIYYPRATVCPSNATNKKVIWRSSNPSVATVSLHTGKVTAEKAGIATIIATTVDGGFQDCVTINVNYCGGSNYRDVTKHNMILQDDGYYICSKCGYRIKSPALQDKDILSDDDYYKVLSCYMSIPYYSKIDREDEGNYSIKATALRLIIDDIRSKSEYSQKYDYVGGDGLYEREYTTGNENDDYYMPVTINYNVIDNGLELILNNGVASGIVELLVGWAIPSQYQFIFFDLADGYTNVTEFLCDLAKKAGYEEISVFLKLILLGSCANDMAVTDKVVKIQFTVGAGVYESKTVFDSNGNLKFQEHNT